MIQFLFKGSISDFYAADSQAGYFGQLRTAKKSASRLREATSNNDLAITLCILMAQQRNRIIFDESQLGLHTKLVGKLYDQVNYCCNFCASCYVSFFSLDAFLTRISIFLVSRHACTVWELSSNFLYP